MIKIFIKSNYSEIPYGLPLMIIILFTAVQSLVGDEAFATTSDVSSQGKSWDRLLIEEVPSLRENIENIANALNEGNYSEAVKQIDDIQAGDNWFNVRNELESRQATDLVTRFDNSLFELARLSKKGDSLISSVKQTQMLSKSMEDIVNKLSNPVVDLQRLVLTTSVIGIVIGSGLFIIPRVRKRFNIKY
jgi:hypothetical protein